MTAKPPSNSKRTAKRVGIRASAANPHAEAWIRQGDADALGKGDTLHRPSDSRHHARDAGTHQGVGLHAKATVADLLRGLLEQEFPEHRRNAP